MELKRFALVATSCWLCGLLVGLESQAAEFKSGEKKVVIASDETIEDDLYLAGQDVVVDGTIKGDLIVGGQTITINGTVEGNVFAAAQSIVVKGTVQGDLMAAGQGILVEGRLDDDARVAAQIFKLAKSGYIGGDLVAAGMSLELEPESNVGSDALLAGMQAILAGKLGRNVYGGLGNCQIDGDIGGNVKLEASGDGEPLPPQAFQQLPPGFSVPAVAGGLNIGEDAKIGGKLTYHSPAEATIANPEAITGGVEHITPAPRAAGAPPPKPTPVQMAIGRLKAMVAVALIGLATVLLIPRWSTEMAANLRYRFPLSLVAGLVGVFGFIAVMLALWAVVILAMILFSSLGLDNLSLASLGVGFFGSVSLAGLMWFGVSFLAPTVFCVFVGRSISRSSAMPTVIAFLIGLVIVAILWALPYSIGWWIALVIVTIGFGAFCVWLVAGPPQELQPVPAAAVVVK